MSADRRTSCVAGSVGASGGVEVLRRKKDQASEATGIAPLVAADVPGDDLVVLQDGHGLLLTGPDDLVAGMVAHLRSIEVHPGSAEPQSQTLLHRTSGLSQLASLAGLAPKPGSRSAEYVRLTPRSRGLLEQHGAIPGANGTFKGFVRSADGHFAGILDWSPATFDPAQIMTLRSAAVGLALQIAIAEVQDSIERVEDKIDRLSDLVSSEQLGKVLGQHRVLVPLVERTTTGQTLSVTDWTTVAALGPEVAQTIEALRSYVSKRLDRVHRKRTPSGKAEELRDLLDAGLLREAIAMLVIAEDNLRLWQQLRMVNVRLREPEHLGATIESARESLAADIEADQALVSAMGVVVGELMETRPLHGFDVVGVRRLDQAGSDVLDLMHSFAETRMLEVEPIEEYQRPGVKAAFGHVGSKILQAAKAAPSSVPFVRSGGQALPAGDDPVFDRSVGALLGVHVGDSLGATLEFVPPERARQLFPDGHRDIIGGGTFGWEAGAPTDDTDLTLAVAEAYRLADETDAIVLSAAEQMLRWYEGGPKDVGDTTASALQRFRRDRNPSTSGLSDEGSQGNGSLMRTMPVAIARADAELRAIEAEAISSVTHAHPVCAVACVAYCDIAHALIEGEAAPAAVERVRVALADGSAPAEHAVADAILFGVQLREGGEWLGATGWVLDSLTLAVWAVLGDESFEETLVQIVMHGGDADTNGAVAGGLLGAKLGSSAIPERWLEPLKASDRLIELARQLVLVRRGKA